MHLPSLIATLPLKSVSPSPDQDHTPAGTTQSSSTTFHIPVANTEEGYYTSLLHFIIKIKNGIIGGQPLTPMEFIHLQQIDSVVAATLLPFDN